MINRTPLPCRWVCYHPAEGFVKTERAGAGRQYKGKTIVPLDRAPEEMIGYAHQDEGVMSHGAPCPLLFLNVRRSEQ